MNVPNESLHATVVRLRKSLSLSRSASFLFLISFLLTAVLALKINEQHDLLRRQAVHHGYAVYDAEGNWFWEEDVPPPPPPRIYSLQPRTPPIPPKFNLIPKPPQIPPKLPLTPKADEEKKDILPPPKLLKEATCVECHSRLGITI